MGHGKNAPSGVSQLGVGFKVPTGTLLGLYLDFTWMLSGDFTWMLSEDWTWNTLGVPLYRLGGSFGAYLGFLYLLLVIIGGYEF